MVKTEMTKHYEFDKTVTDLVTRDQLFDRLNAYLSDAPLNIGSNDYCYVKIVGNHLEIGRAKIILDE